MPASNPLVTFTMEECLEADRRLQALDEMVKVLAARAPKNSPQCFGCVWEQILKPLVVPCLGNSRNRPRDAHSPAPGGRSWAEPLDLAALFQEETQWPEPTTAMEAFLRTSQAYDLLTDKWLKLLKDADPGKGHGLPQQATRTK